MGVGYPAVGKSNGNMLYNILHRSVDTTRQAVYSKPAASLTFGAKVFASNFIVALFLDIRSLLIGQIYSSEALGFFNRGKQFPQAVMESVNGTIHTVLLPVYSQKQDSVSSVTKMVSKTVRLSSFLLFPMMVGLAAVAEPLVSLLLTDKWLECVPYLQIFAIGYLFQAIQLAIIQAIKAIGDSGTPLKLEIIKKCVELFFLVVTIKKGVLIFASSLLLCSAISHLLNMFAARKILKYPLKQQIADILPATLFSVVMAICVKSVIRILDNELVSLLGGIGIGIAVYLLLCVLFHVPELELIKKSISKTKRNFAG